MGVGISQHEYDTVLVPLLVKECPLNTESREDLSPLFHLKTQLFSTPINPPSSWITLPASFLNRCYSKDQNTKVIGRILNHWIQSYETAFDDQKQYKEHCNRNAAGLNGVTNVTCLVHQYFASKPEAMDLVPHSLQSIILERLLQTMILWPVETADMTEAEADDWYDWHVERLALAITLMPLCYHCSFNNKPIRAFDNGSSLQRFCSNVVLQLDLNVFQSSNTATASSSSSNSSWYQRASNFFKQKKVAVLPEKSILQTRQVLVMLALSYYSPQVRETLSQEAFSADTIIDSFSGELNAVKLMWLYTILYSSDFNVLQERLVKLDIPSLLLLLLKRLCDISTESSSSSTEEERYMLLATIFLLVNDAEFCSSAFDDEIKITWLRNSAVHMSVGSLLVLTLVKTLRYNTMTRQDSFINSVGLAVLANIAPNVKNLHTLPSQKLVEFTIVLFRNTSNISPDVLLYVITLCLSNSQNPQLVYTLLRSQQVLIELELKGVLAIVEAFKDYICRESGMKSTASLSVEELLCFIKAGCNDAGSVTHGDVCEIRLEYEENQDQEFFRSYIWKLIKEQQ